jgi:hypothetical protein
MESAVKAIRKFQTVALVTTAGAVGYYFLHEGKTTNFQSDSSESSTGRQLESKKQGHTLTGELVDKDKQGMIAKAVDTDCPYCLETRKKLFGMFKSAKQEVDPTN